MHSGKRSVLMLAALQSACWATTVTISGRVVDQQEWPVPRALISVVETADERMMLRQTVSDDQGAFSLTVEAQGSLTIRARANGFTDISQPLTAATPESKEIKLVFRSLAQQRTSITVVDNPSTAYAGFPDPSTQFFDHDQLLDANPGRPGAPVSIPGYPIETASGGVKAPQYFAPGVAGDHGEPIATYLQVGTYLLPNNLSANAHGNGYSDPNILIGPVIESVQVDNGAFDVRKGNHSVNLSDTYSLPQRARPFVTIASDFKDADIAAGWSPADPSIDALIAIEAAYGDGFLKRPEHRQQYKVNALRGWSFGAHKLTLLAIGYYGFSYVPGLVPLETHVAGDTIDSRQKDQTHTGAIALNDIWKVSATSQLQSSAYFRSYTLSLYSNFGDGLIRQSEYRTVTGGNETYVNRTHDKLSFMAGADYLRDAPRRLDLDHYDNNSDSAFYGPFQKVTANNVTLNFITPYVALNGKPFRWLRYDLGWRRDQLGVDNEDLLRPRYSFSRWTGINSPKATISLIPPETWWAPVISFSYGQAFFSNDPRIGNGTVEGSIVSRAHSYQLVLSKDIARTNFRVTLGRLTQEQSLAKIDPDTGLQFDEGPSRNYFLTVAGRHYFGWGSVEGSFAKADSRDLESGLPVPEAPRLIIDFLGTLEHLPFKLRARGEYERVGAKPLGDGFVSVPVTEVRGALTRSWQNNRFDAGLNFQIASGYTGQTTEVLAIPGEGEAFERVVGIYLPSYVGVSFTFRF